MQEAETVNPLNTSDSLRRGNYMSFHVGLLKRNRLPLGIWFSIEVLTCAFLTFFIAACRPRGEVDKLMASRSIVRTIATALAMYKSEFGVFPPTPDTQDGRMVLQMYLEQCELDSADNYINDAYGNRLRFAESGNTLSVSSDGPNRTFENGRGDDIVVTVTSKGIREKGEIEISCDENVRAFYPSGDRSVESGGLPRAREIRLTLWLIDGAKMEFVLIPLGPDTLGSDYSHQSELGPEPFFLGRCEVTQEQWQAVMGNNPSKYVGQKLPVDSVSMEDCQNFLKAVNTWIGKNTTCFHFHLPSVAQRRFACIEEMSLPSTKPIGFRVAVSHPKQSARASGEAKAHSH